MGLLMFDFVLFMYDRRLHACFFNFRFHFNTINITNNGSDENQLVKTVRD